MKPTHPAFEADFKAFLDGELPFWRRAQVRRHLQFCPPCREELRIMQTIEQELKTEVAAPLGADLRAKILDFAPGEAPKIAPKPPLRVRPQFVFAAGSTFVLAAIVMFPVFNRARENARRSSSQANVSQIGLGMKQYVQDYDERLADQMASAPAAGAASAPSQASQAPTGQSMRSVQNWNLGESIVPTQRQVHKQGSLCVAVDDAEASGNSVEITVKNVGGFVAQNALSTAGDGRKTATLDVRVPVAQFEAVVGKIGKLGAVREKSVNGEDITQRVTQAGAQKQSLARELSIREAQLRAAKGKARTAMVSDVRQLRLQANQARATRIPAKIRGARDSFRDFAGQSQTRARREFNGRNQGHGARGVEFVSGDGATAGSAFDLDSGVFAAVGSGGIFVAQIWSQDGERELKSF